MLALSRSVTAVFDDWLSSPPGEPMPNRMLLGPRLSSYRPTQATKWPLVGLPMA